MTKRFLSAILIVFVIISETAFCSSLPFTVTREIDYVTINGKSEDALVFVQVINPEQQPTAAADIGFEDSVFYIETLETNPVDGTYSTSFELNEVDSSGYYKIYVNDSASTGEYAQIYNFSSADLAAALNAFKTAVDSEFSIIYNQYKEAFDATIKEIAALNANCDLLEHSFEIAKTGYFDGKLAQESAFTSVVDIQKLLKITYTVDMLKRGIAIDEIITNLDKAMPDDVMMENFKYIFAKITDLDSLDSADKLIAAIEKASIMSNIYNSSYQACADTIVKYAENLGISTNDLNSGFTAVQIAKNIDTSEAAVIKYAKDGMGTVVHDIVSKLKSSSRPSGITGGGSGGGGMSGGKGGDSIVTENTPIVLPEKETIATLKSFNDLKGYEWAETAIYALKDKNIVSGKSELNYAPADKLTREEAVTLLVKAFDLTAVQENETVFTDCDIKQWYYPYVVIGYQSNIVKGISEFVFGVGNHITRQDLSVLINRCLMANKVYLESGETKFADNDDVAEYAISAIGALSENGIINGYEDNRFLPNGNITRAEAAVMIYRAMEAGGIE